MSPGLRAALAATVFFLLLLALAPARLLGFVLPADQVALSGYSGTVWRGTASRAMVATPGRWGDHSFGGPGSYLDHEAHDGGS